MTILFVFYRSLVHWVLLRLGLKIKDDVGF